MDPNIENLGKQVRLRRQLMDLSQTKFAHLVGVDFQVISRIERGRGSKLSTISKIARKLEIPLSELFQPVKGETNE